MPQGRCATLSSDCFPHPPRVRIDDLYFATPTNVRILWGILRGDEEFRERYASAIDTASQILALTEVMKTIDALADRLIEGGKLFLPEMQARSVAPVLDAHLRERLDPTAIQWTQFPQLEMGDEVVASLLARDWKSEASIRRALLRRSKPRDDRCEAWLSLFEDVHNRLEWFLAKICWAWHEWVLEHRKVFGVDQLEFLVPDAHLEVYRSIP